ncbi:hypothetical protein D9M72_555300 [compost metagenome]
MCGGNVAGRVEGRGVFVQATVFQALHRVVGHVLFEQCDIGGKAVCRRVACEVHFDHPGGFGVFRCVAFDRVTPPVHAEADPHLGDALGFGNAEGADVVWMGALRAAGEFTAIEDERALRYQGALVVHAVGQPWLDLAQWLLAREEHVDVPLATQQAQGILRVRLQRR